MNAEKCLIVHSLETKTFSLPPATNPMPSGYLRSSRMLCGSFLTCWPAVYSHSLWTSIQWKLSDNIRKITQPSWGIGKWRGLQNRPVLSLATRCQIRLLQATNQPEFWLPVNPLRQFESTARAEVATRTASDPPAPATLGVTPSTFPPSFSRYYRSYWQELSEQCGEGHGVLGTGGWGWGGCQEGALFGDKCTWASGKQAAPGPWEDVKN